MCKETALYIGRDYQRQRCICRYFASMGIVLHKARTAGAARKLIEKYCYHLILIHFDTVQEETLNFCRFVRFCSNSAVVIALMNKPRLAIESELFDNGINDVVTGKQMTARVLAKRIRAHLLNNSKLSWPKVNTIRLNDTVIDLDRREVWRDGRVYQLRGILADLMKYFLENSNRIISREELRHSAIWADSICSSANEGGKTFDVAVGKLRKIIESDITDPQIIKSVRGVGWQLIANGNITNYGSN